MNWSVLRNCLAACLLLTGLLIGCSGDEPTAVTDIDGAIIEEDADHDAHEAEGGMLALPTLQSVDLSGGKLRVIATTGIIGDVVAQVAGDAIELTTLMGPGQDPHSYEPGARELTAVADAHLIFVNGWNLEEGLIKNLVAIGENALIVPISANIEPLSMPPNPKGVTGVDPHVWVSIHSVEQWVKNISAVLSVLDSTNAAVYAANADRYLGELAILDAYAQEQLAVIPAGQRVLVTNHRAFSYFARDYDFEMLGTVIPGLSSLSEPSADDLADLIGKMESRSVCAIFTETTVSDQLAQVVAAELTVCDAVKVLPLYTGSLGPPGSGADNYLGMMQFNVDTIAAGLR